VHDRIGTDEPNPLPAWLRELEAEIETRYPNYARHQLLRGAEREIFKLVGMYASALVSWIEGCGAALSLDVMATSFATLGFRLSPELETRLIEQRHRINLWAATLTVIENDRLGETVLPAALRSALDCDQLRFNGLLSSLDQRAESEAAELSAEAHSRVKTLFASAYATASMSHCHHQVLTLAEAHLTYCHRRKITNSRCAASNKP
jgi:hypothetical protein